MSTFLGELGNQTPAWISYDWGNPRLVEEYSITYTNGSITTRAPSIWQLQGWNGSSWITVDSRSGETRWRGSETRTFQVQQPGHYSKYRLHVQDDNDSRSGIVVLPLGDLSLKGCTTGGSDPIEVNNLYGVWHEDWDQAHTESSAMCRRLSIWALRAFEITSTCFRGALVKYPVWHPMTVIIL